MRCEPCEGTGRAGKNGPECTLCSGFGTVPNPPEDSFAEFPEEALRRMTVTPTKRGPKWARSGGVLNPKDYE